MKTRVDWYARSGNIAKMGPYKSQEEATNAIRLAPSKDPVWSNVLFHDNAFVWPETVKIPSPKKKK